MPSPEVTFANQVRKVRRVGQRFAERVADGSMRSDDVDLAAFYFTANHLEERIVALGLLDPALGLEKRIEGMAQGILFAVKAHGRVDDLEEALTTLTEGRRAAKARAKAKSDEPPAFENRPKGDAPSPKSLRQAQADQRAAIRMIAVHLVQRSLYRGLSRALLKMATDQMRGKPDRLLPHGALQVAARVGRKRRSEKSGKIGGLTEIEQALSDLSGRRVGGAP